MVQKIHFEGLVDRLSPQQLEFISEVLDKHGFGQARVVIEKVGNAGDNYAADVRRIIAKIDGEEFRMVAKIATKNETFRSMGMKDIFITEAKMYTDVLPKFAELEDSVAIPEEDKLKYATCYGAYLEGVDEIVLLEDLQPHGYKILDRLKSLSNETVKVIMKNFAKIHGYSFVLRHQQPETFESITNGLVNMWENMGNNEQMKAASEKMEDDIIKVLDNEDYTKLIKGKMVKLSDIAKEMSQTDKLDPKHCVIQHGDAWTNNILFQVEDDKVISCCMIDYQIARVASPASDIGYMVFNCTDYETRAKHYHEWINYYHSELGKIMSMFGLKVEQVYNREKLDADLKRYGILSLVQSIYVSTATTKETSDAAKFKDAMDSTDTDFNQLMETGSLMNSNKTSVNAFKERVTGIIDSHIELGYVEI